MRCAGEASGEVEVTIRRAPAGPLERQLASAWLADVSVRVALGVKKLRVRARPICVSAPSSPSCSCTRLTAPFRRRSSCGSRGALQGWYLWRERCEPCDWSGSR
eukprot:6210535-Pleurochrysis_carterae.AAC.4